MKSTRLLPYALLLGLLLTLAAQAPPRPSLAQTLRDSRWKKRVLLVAAPNARQADYQRQKALLANAKAELDDRDFLVIEVFYNQFTTAGQQVLKQKAGLQPPNFAAVLIGKDGGVKLKSSRPLLPADLFGTVDKMPMRREEMQRPATKRRPE